MYNFVKDELERLIRLEMRKIPKIAIFGLDGAGKTSLVKTVLYEFESLISFAPTMTTKAKNFEFLGRELIILDVGGLNRYTKYIFNENEEKWIGIDYFYFIIDVQDPEKIRPSVASLLKLLEFLHPINPTMELFFFFHKYDAQYSGGLDFTEIESEFLQTVLPNMERYNYHIVVFHTSVHEKKTLISSFTQPLLRNKDIYSTLCKTIKQFCFENRLEFGILLVDDVEIGHFYNHHDTLLKINETLIEIYRRYQQMQELGRIDTKYEGENRIHSNLFNITVQSKKFEFVFHIGLDSSLNPKEVDRIKEITHEFTKNLSKILIHSEMIRLGVLNTDEIK